MLAEQFSNYLKTSDGQQIFYATNFEIKSQGEFEDVLVFNYGLVCSHQHWESQLKFFDDLGYKILIHHYRGHFQSSSGTDVTTMTMEQIASDLDELLNYIGIKKCLMIGHSMGVNTTLEYARNHQDRLQGLVLTSGTVLPVTEIMFGTNITEVIKSALLKLVKKYPETMKKIWNSAGYNPALKKAVHILGFNHKTVPEEFVDIYLNKTAYLGPEVFVQLFEEMSKHDILASLEEIRVPVLVVGGERDVLIPNYLQMLLHQKLPNSQLYIMHGASHVPQVDFPDLYNERLHVFVEKVIAPAGVQPKA